MTSSIDTLAILKATRITLTLVTVRPRPAVDTLALALLAKGGFAKTIQATVEIAAKRGAVYARIVFMANTLSRLKIVHS